MKLYIKSSSNNVEVETNKLTFEFEYIVEVAYDNIMPVSASIRKSGDLHFITSKILNQETGKYTRVEREIDSDFYAFVSSILSVAHSCGFVDLNVDKSPSSDSLYFALCHDSDFTHSVVEFIFYLRLSDHPLPVRSKDRDIRDARARMLAEHEDESKEYSWINKKYEGIDFSKGGTTPFTVIDDYVEYDGNRYDTINEIISDVKRKLTKLKKRYKPESTSDFDSESQ